MGGGGYRGAGGGREYTLRAYFFLLGGPRLWNRGSTILPVSQRWKPLPLLFLVPSSRSVHLSRYCRFVTCRCTVLVTCRPRVSQLLRRNCFVRVALDVKSMPPPPRGERWTSAGGWNQDARCVVVRKRTQGAIAVQNEKPQTQKHARLSPSVAARQRSWRGRRG